MAARRRPGLSLLDGCGVGQLWGSPRPTVAWPRCRRPSCALVVGSTPWDCVVNVRTSSVCAAPAPRLLGGTLIESNSIARAKFGRAVPKSRGRRLAAGAASIEMRRINDISD